MSVGLRAPVYGLVYGYGKSVIPPEPPIPPPSVSTGGGGGGFMPSTRYIPGEKPEPEIDARALQEDDEFMRAIPIILSKRLIQ